MCETFSSKMRKLLPALDMPGVYELSLIRWTMIVFKEAIRIDG